MRRHLAFPLTSFFALIIVGFALISSHGQASAATGTEACLACHPRSFAGEVHGLGLTNPMFKSAWEEAGSPKECLACHSTGFDTKTGEWKSDTISCEACHSPITEDHPNQKMPVDKSNDLCGTCHNDSHFGWTDWKTSVHYQRSMTCSNCHDPHLPQRLSDENVSAFCQKCHEDITKRAEHSVHSQAGVTCVSCHLGPKTGPDQYHQVPDHSFKPVLATCNNCHAKQMHDPAPTAMPAATFTPTPVPPTPTPVSFATPTPASGVSGIAPLSTMDFTFLGAGLLGLGAIGGLALSPVLDWLMSRLFNKKK